MSQTPPKPPGAPWRPQGSRYYLERQGRRLGVHADLIHHPRVLDNRQLAKISALMAEVCLNYYESPRINGRHAPWQVERAKGTLAACESEVQKTHAVAAAAAAMVDEAYAAFGETAPLRTYRVVVVGEPDTARDAAIESARTASAELVASLRAEVAALRAENESLTERLTAPASPYSTSPTVADGAGSRVASATITHPEPVAAAAGPDASAGDDVPARSHPSRRSPARN